MTDGEKTSFAICIKEHLEKHGIHKAVFTDLALQEEVIARFDKQVRNAPMTSLIKRRDERLMISPPLKNAKTMLICLVPYPAAPDNPLIATYALFEDYHKVIMEKLLSVSSTITSMFPDVNLYPFVDSGPVAEKLFAEKAGLGFQGRNTLIINRELGSRFFLCGFLISCELPIDVSVNLDNHDSCGKCRACETACPTCALSDGQLDIHKCLAWQTIEFKGPFSGTPVSGEDATIFGCGICEKVCPFNKGKPEKQDPAWKVRYDLASASLHELKNFAESDFHGNFVGLPIERTGKVRLLRNIGRSFSEAFSSTPGIH